RFKFFSIVKGDTPSRSLEQVVDLLTKTFGMCTMKAMATHEHVVTRCLERWKNDLRELTAGVTKDPFVQGRGRRWDRDFPGEIGTFDIHYSVFLAVLNMIPA